MPRLEVMFLSSGTFVCLEVFLQVSYRVGISTRFLEVRYEIVTGL